MTYVPPPMVPPEAATAPQFDPAATVASDAPCRKCSYNLRGLTYGGRCPECGTPVGLSTIGDLLRYSDPSWLLKLARGLSFILWGIVVAIVVTVAGGMLLRNESAQAWVGIIGGALGLYGAWLLTSPDPSGLGEARSATSRKLVRIAMLVGVGGAVGQAMAQSLSGAMPGSVILVSTFVAMLVSLFRAVGEFAKFFYLEKLACESPMSRSPGGLGCCTGDTA